MNALVELQLDGLVGPTHGHAGLSVGNLASMRHGGERSRPRAAALQGLAKMRRVLELGGLQGVLPPQRRPLLAPLRALGFEGTDGDVLAAARSTAPELLSAVSSASAMWTANAATVAPGCDTLDGRTRLLVANLASLWHRAQEAPATLRALRATLNAPTLDVLPPLPSHAQLGDEGAANHLRLEGPAGVLHLFGWGRDGFADDFVTSRFRARQTRQASAAVARRLRLRPELVELVRQAPAGIDAGAFHSDVLAVGSGATLLVHEHAFEQLESTLARLRTRLGELHVLVASDAELPVARAVASYPFNSQLLATPRGLVIVAPVEARADDAARAYLERAVDVLPTICAVEWVDVGDSMANGGGPACLRLRVPLAAAELAAVRERVLLTPSRLDALERWVERHYPESCTQHELLEPAWLETQDAAFTELEPLLALPPGTLLQQDAAT